MIGDNFVHFLQISYLKGSSLAGHWAELMVALLVELWVVKLAAVSVALWAVA